MYIKLYLNTWRNKINSERFSKQDISEFRSLNTYILMKDFKSKFAFYPLLNKLKLNMCFSILEKNWTIDTSAKIFKARYNSLNYIYTKKIMVEKWI